MGLILDRIPVNARPSCCLNSSARSKILELVGPLLYPVSLFIVGLLVLTIFRGILAFQYWDRLIDTPEVWLLFPIGLLMDVLLFSYLIAISSILLLALPDLQVKKRSIFFIIWFTFTLSVVIYM